eukprot:SAG25_NODE_76_length_16934_cov_51.463202_14_plen_174_part_00
MQPLRVSPAQPAWHRQGSKAAGRRRTRALLLESLRGVATRTAEISGVLARTTGATRPEKRAESRDPRPPHRSPRSCCAAVNAAISLAPPAERTTHTPTHREGGLRVSCACELGEASSRHAARCGCAGRPVRLRQSTPPLCRAFASAGAAFRCPGAAVGLTERWCMRCGSDLPG